MKTSVIVGLDVYSQWIPPPQVVAVLLMILRSVSVGLDPVQLIPPPLLWVSLIIVPVPFLSVNLLNDAVESSPASNLTTLPLLSPSIIVVSRSAPKTEIFLPL